MFSCGSACAIADNPHGNGPFCGQTARGPAHTAGMKSSSNLSHDWNPGDIWEGYQATSLLEMPGLARAAGVARVFLKNEAERPLGNFKVLGGMAAALRAIRRHAMNSPNADGAAHRRLRLVCASDGNHGLAVASAAQRADVRATVYLPHDVSPVRVDRIRATGADIVLVDGTYDDAVQCAQAAALAEDCLLVPDTTPDADHPVVKDVMTGYGVLTDELICQLAAAGNVQPTHAFIQAGVGGLAAAIAEGLHAHMHAAGRLVVVEPHGAACVARALREGRPVRIEGDLRTTAEMLACGLASAPALEILLRHRAQSMRVTESELEAGPAQLLAAGGPASTPSGAAGLAGLLAASRQPEQRERCGLDAGSIVLLVVTEGPPDVTTASTAQDTDVHPFPLPSPAY